MAFRSGKTRGSTFRAKIREELVCAICLDFLKEPKVLNCAHSFCLACLEKHAQSNWYKKGPGAQLQQGDVECPSCRQVTRIPSGGVRNLTTNFTLKKIVSLVSDNERRATQTILSTRTIKKQSISQTAPNCPTHFRPIEYFCLDCNELLCPKCISSVHRSHNFEDADRVLPQQIQTLRSMIQPACEVATRAERMMDQLVQQKDHITANSRGTIEAVESYFRKLRKVIDQRESALKSTVQKYCDVKLSRIDSQYQMLQNHHDAILDKVAELERLIEDNDMLRLLTQKQTISEDIEAQEQSVIAVGDLLKEASNQGSLLFREGQPANTFAELGTVNERQQKPNSPFVTLRRLIVSEEEDPYLDVPLRFEDGESSAPQRQVRVDETKSKIEYEPEGKPNRPDTIYNVPTPLNRDSTKSAKPEVPPRKTKESDSPPVPPRRPRTRRITPTSITRPDSESAPKAEWSHDYQNFDPSRLRHTARGADRKRKETLRKSQTLPNSPYARSNSTPTVQMHEVPRSILPSDSSDSSEDYEPLDDLPVPIPKQRTKPPPLPQRPLDHPSRIPPTPKAKPRKRSETASPDNPTDSLATRPHDSLPVKPHDKVLKKRSLTLPTDFVPPPPLPPKELPFILTPLKIIDNKMLSTPSTQETIYPNGICCCPEMCDRIVVTDVFNHCLRLLDSCGTFVEKIGREGRSGGQFKEPTAVAVDSNCNLFVTERDNPRVQKFTPNGKYMTKFGQKTLLGSQLGDPMGVAIGTDDSVLITDWDKNEIYMFSNEGKLMDTIGKENNLLKFPAGVTVNRKGNLLVADRGNHCVWEITISGDVVQRIGSKGTLPGQLYFPYGVIVLSNRTIAITESGNNRVSIFSESGRFIRCFGEKGSEPGQFDHPRYLCVNSSGHVIVVDQMNQRLQVFQVN